jgi:hypothetical protein
MKKIYTSVLALILAVVSIGIISEFAIGGVSQLGYYVMPPAYVSAAGGATFLGPLSNAQRTYQMLLHDTLLSGLEGQDIKALTWRLLPSATSNWPAADVNFTNYDIYIGEGIDPSQRHFTFDSNYSTFGVKKRVRFGPLTILAGSFPFGGNPTTFGTDITFDSAYRYNGGHLTIEIRHTGFTGTSASVDAAGTSSPGYLVTYSGTWVGNYTATSGGLQGNLCIHRLNAESPVSVVNESGVVKDFTLMQNYPNPFNPVTNISFTMPKAGIVTLKVYDVTGTEVMAIINNEHISAGTKSQFVDASGLSSGVYFYSLYIDGAKIDTKKMMLVK